MYLASRCSYLAVLGIALTLAYSASHAQLFVAVPAANNDASAPSAVVAVNPQAYAVAVATPEDAVQRQVLPMPGGPVTVVVNRFEVFDNATIVNLITANGPVRFVPQKQLLLRGRVEGHPNSRVVLAVLPDQVYGTITINGRQLYVQPFDRVGGTSIAFAAENAKHPAPWTCGQEDLKDQPPIPPMPPTQPGKKGGADQQQRLIRTLPLAIEGDYDMFLDHGQNAAKAVAYAEAVTAAASDIYFRDVDAKLRVKQFELWTVNDPYTSITSSGMLTQFRDRWRSLHGAIDRAVAVLLSGVNNIGGIAYVNVLCSKQNGYAVVGLNNNVNYPATGYVWDTDVMAHELGHNIGSLHTHSCSWAPPIDSCYAAENGNCFAGTKPVRGTIMSYCHLTNMGTSLEFHPRVVSLFNTRINNASCRELISSLTVTARADTTVCHGDTIALTATIDGGTAPIGVSWTGPNVINPSGPNPRAVVTSTAVYRVAASDATNSQAIDSVRITTSPLPLSAAITPPLRVCPGDPTTLVVNATGGTGSYRYTWVVNGITTGIASAMHTFTTADSLTIVVRVRDAQDCSTFVQTAIRTFDKPVNTLQAPTVACAGDTVTMLSNPRGGTPPYNMEWWVNGKDADEIEPTLRFRIMENSVVRCVVTDKNFCTDTIETFVRVRTTLVQFSPPRVTVPEIAACLEHATMSVSVRNSGSDTALLSTIDATLAQAMIDGAEVPFVVAPGDQRTLLVRVRLPIDRDVFDTLRIRDLRCGWEYPLPIEGRRGTLVADPSGGIDLGIVAECSQGADRHALVQLRNGSPVALSIGQLRAEGVDSIVANYPISVAGRGRVSIAVRLMGINKALMSIPALRAEYTSAGCEGTAVIPVSVTVAPYELSVPSVLDFGVVRQGAAVAQRSFSVVPATSAGLEQMEVTGVEVTGPFQVTDLRGARLRGGRATVASVAFVPPANQPKGEVLGSIAFTVDSCAAETTIPLRAWLDDGVSVDEREGPTAGIVYSSVTNTVTVTGEDACTMNFYDVQGRLIYSAQYSGTAVDVPASVRGVIAVSAECAGNMRLRTVILVR
jgi:hypothetical protein